MTYYDGQILPSEHFFVNETDPIKAEVIHGGKSSK